MVTCTPPAPGIVQVEVVFNMDGQIVENVLHYDTGLGATVPDDKLLSIAAFVDANLTTSPWVEMGGALVYQHTVARDLTPGTGGAVALSAGHANTPMPGGGTALPNNVALAVTFKTAQGGRSGRGRMYLGGVTTSDEAGQNHVSAGFANNVTTVTVSFFNAWKAAQGGPGPCVLSKWHNKACRTQAVAYPITAVVTDTTLDSQRRRLPGRGK